MDRQIQAFLAARGKRALPLVDYYTSIDADGLTRRIGYWNEAVLGPAPTPAEVATMRSDEFMLASRRKDLLADAAARVRSRDIPAWTAMTAAQKKAAVQAEADVWANMRDFVENNL